MTFNFIMCLIISPQGTIAAMMSLRTSVAFVRPAITAAVVPSYPTQTMKPRVMFAPRDITVQREATLLSHVNQVTFDLSFTSIWPFACILILLIIVLFYYTVVLQIQTFVVADVARFYSWNSATINQTHYCALVHVTNLDQVKMVYSIWKMCNWFFFSF